MMRGSRRQSARSPRAARRALGAALTAWILALPSSAPGAGDGARDSAASIATYGYAVVRARPHDTDAYTQGLAFKDGLLYEGTGRYGASRLRAIDLDTGKIRKQINLPARYFGEGIAILGDKIYQLTWREHKGFIYDRASFALIREFGYDGEGWGLTTDGVSLIMSDGTDRLRFLDPRTLQIRHTVRVRADGVSVADLNELEYVKGEIFANVWQRNVIARIDPTSGAVRGWIDLAGLPRVANADAVLNGIAYDEAGDRLFVTGKLWPQLYEIRLK